MKTAAIVVAGLAALLHVYIFWMESIAWTRPEIWKRFGVGSQAQADTTRPMAYNQGFYNLFLGLGALLGIVLWLRDGSTADAGRTLVLFTTACMALAAVVLTTTGKGYLKAAATQGTLPVIAFVLAVVA